MPATLSRNWAAWLVLSGSLVLTFWGWHSARESTERLNLQRFNNRTAQITNATVTRIANYKQALVGGAGLFYADGGGTRKDWQAYVGTLDLTRNYPGMTGLGFSQMLRPDQVAGFESSIRSEGFPQFRVWPAGPQPFFTSIRYLEPFDWRNRRAFGFDMHSEPTRRAAMDAAMRSNQVVSSGKVILKQETDRDTQAGFLSYIPVWKHGFPGAVSDAQLRDNLVGWVYCAIRAGDMMAGIRQVIPEGLRLQIFDGTRPNDADLLFDSHPGGDKHPHFARTVTIDANMRPWTVRVTTLPEYTARSGADYANALLGGGILLSLLLYLVVLNQSLLRDRAQSLADRMTASLRLSEGQLKEITANAKEGIIVMDHDERVSFVNPHASELLGWDEGELLAQPAGKLFGRERQSGAPSARPGDSIEHWIRKDGSRVPVEVNRSSIIRGPGEDVGTVMMFRDITLRLKADRAIRDSERFRALFEHSPDAQIIVDSGGFIRDVNKVASQRTGLERAALVGEPLGAVVELSEPDELDAALRMDPVNGAVRSQPLLSGQIVGAARTPVELSLSRIRIGDDPLLLVSARDITERTREDRLRIEENRAMQMVVEGQPMEDVLRVIIEAVEHHSPQMHGFVLIPDAASARFARCVSAHLPSGYMQWLEGRPIGPDSVPSGIAAWSQRRIIVSDIPADPVGWTFRHMPGGIGFKAGVCSPVIGSDGKLLSVFTVYFRKLHTATEQELALVDRAIHLIRIVIERYGSQARVQYMATHDALTALPNRNLLQDRLDQAIHLAHRDRRKVAVMFLDLDRFKIINDSLGHDVGDALLMEVAARLAATVGEGDTIARLGGDEFVILLDNYCDAEYPSTIARAVLRTIAEPVVVGNHSLVVSGSMGISVYPDNSGQVGELLKHADLAMYQAKQRGRNQFHFFGEELNARAYSRLMLENGLRAAIEENQLVVHYQPRIDSRSGRITGLEALVRWVHPERGLIQPDVFIPLAEETGMIARIGEWVLKTACVQHALWRKMGVRDLSVSVNLSARQLNSRNVAGRIGAILAETRMDPEALELEITESMVMENVDTALDTLNRIRDMGVHLSMDDFGTGYSSLSYLKRLPIHALKIDKSFVRDLSTDPEDEAIVNTIIAMAHTLDLKVVAEGVETPGHAAHLARSNCDEMQGFQFSRPLPAEDVTPLLLEGRAYPIPEVGGA